MTSKDAGFASLDGAPASSPDTQSPRAPQHWRRRAILLAALALVTWVVLPRLLAVNPVEPLLSLRWPYVLGALVAQGGMQWGRGLLLRGVSEGEHGQLGRRRATLVVLGASSVGLLGGGFPGYAAALYRWSRAAGAPPAGALTAGWMPSLLFSAAVAALAIGGSAAALTSGFLSRGELAGLAMGLSLVILPVVAAGWVLTHPASAARVVQSLTRVVARLRRRPWTADAASVMTERIDALRNPRWWPLAWAALFSAACDVLSVWALLAAANVKLSFAATCAAWGIPHLLGNASLLPGGAGVVELTMTPFLTRLGVGAAPALAVVLGYRALAFWLPLLGGLPVIFWLERTRK